MGPCMLEKSRGQGEKELQEWYPLQGGGVGGGWGTSQTQLLGCGVWGNTELSDGELATSEFQSWLCHVQAAESKAPGHGL